MAIKSVSCAVLVAFCWLQLTDAEWTVWSSGPHSIYVDGSGFPGVTRDWSVSVGWRYRFARRNGQMAQCLRLADTMIKREEWQAVEPRRQPEIRGMANRVFVWHTGSKTCDLIGQNADECQACLQEQSCVRKIVNAIQNADLEQGKDDIGYNFLIDQNGVIYEGRGWGIVGQHTAGKNAMSIGVALIGDFSQTEPSQAVQDALKSLIFCGKMTQELTPNAAMTTGPAMAGQAFYNMLNRCDGLCDGE